MPDKEQGGKDKKGFSPEKPPKKPGGFKTAGFDPPPPPPPPPPPKKTAAEKPTHEEIRGTRDDEIRESGFVLRSTHPSHK